MCYMYLKYSATLSCLYCAGHTDRVLHMAMSPDGTSVVSGAADETLRLWNCFAVDPAKAKSAVRAKASSTIPLSKGIR